MLGSLKFAYDQIHIRELLSDLRASPTVFLKVNYLLMKFVKRTLLDISYLAYSFAQIVHSDSEPLT